VNNPAWGEVSRDSETGSVWKYIADMWMLKASGLSLPALLQCPFCAGQGYCTRVLRGGCEDGEPDAWAYTVVCRCCAAEGPWCKSNEWGAVSNWNRRPTAKEMAAELEEPAAGHLAPA
jgi:hypothetical protein